MSWTWFRRWLGPEAPRTEASDVGADAALMGDEVQTRHAFYHDIAQARLRAQDEHIRSIDNKTTSYFTIGSTILAIVAAFAASENELVERSVVAESALFLGSCLYVVMAAFYVWSLQPGKSAESPDMEQWGTIGRTTSIETLYAALGDSYVEAYLQNEPEIERKARRSAGALWTLFGEVVCLAASILAPFWPPW